MPGTAVFHKQPVAAFHSIGTFFSRHVPSPRGPRKIGQFSPSTGFRENAMTPTNSIQPNANNFISSVFLQVFVEFPFVIP
jgi:hypothetical protein